ncbi:hypothetical protein KVH15_18450 [Streptomyces olivaceus]|uniref:hypothetical protein n=1 Tax=Streptomyces olivaceus TaxID=47716 RepID=UPI001CD03A74|nr:hypothetical protein [Streptomyces olivaceus]MBZ6082990.1 hypothetical protein [Streptomyces olivaceus]
MHELFGGPVREQSLGLHCGTGHGGLPRGEMADCLRGPGPLTPVDGALAVSAGPGLGIEVGEAAVRAAETGWRHPVARWRHPAGRIAEW